MRNDLSGRPVREPVPRETFRAAGRDAARRLSRHGMDASLQIIAWGLLGLAALLVAARVSTGVLAAVGTVANDVGGPLQSRPTTVTALVLPAVAGGAASADPIFDDLPSFTAQPRLLLVGHLPTFALEPGRKIDLSLNNRILGSFALDVNGRFGTEITLGDGPNVIVARLVGAQGEIIAATNATVVLDRAAPPLTLTRPKSGEVIDGSQITVDGKTAPRVSVRINDRIVAPNPDGSFSETFNVPPGAFTVVAIARNEAGLETTSRVSVSVNAKPTAPVAVSVSLDRASARAGQPVSATVTVVRDGALVSGITLTLSVGVVAIGSARTDVAGRATISFDAPAGEGDFAVVAIAADTAGRAILKVVR